MTTYELGEEAGSPFIACRICGMVSFNQGDIQQRYCGSCHQFHELLQTRAGRVWITQWLCPKRHCAVAAMWQPGETTARAVKQRGEREFFESGALNRHCGICGGALETEHAATRWTTMEEAEREGRKLEAANLFTRTLIGGKF